MGKYADIAKAQMDACLENHKKLYSSMIPSDFTIPTELEAILDLETKYALLVGKASSYRPNIPTINLNNDIIKKYSAQIKQQQEDIDKLQQEKNNEIARLTKEHEDQIREAQDASVSEIKPLMHKHATLMSYKDKIEDICRRYGISPTEIQISSDLTMEEYECLLDAAIEGCQSLIMQKQAKFNPIALLYKPLDWGDNPLIQMVALTGFAIAFHWVGGLLAVAMFIWMYKSTIGIYKKLDKLKIAESMMYTPDFNRFISTEKVDAIEAINTEELDKKYDDMIAIIKKGDPNAKMSQELQEYNTEIADISDIIEQSKAEIQQLYTDTCATMRERLTKIQEAKQEVLSKSRRFGDGMIDEDTHFFPSNRYVLGLLKGAIEQRVPIPMGNYVFNSADPGMKDFLKLMLVNSLLDIKEKHQYVTIYDSVDLGKDFAEFLSCESELHDYIKVTTENLDKVLKDERDYVTKNIRICGDRTLDEVNKTAEEKQMVTYDYHLLIIMSGSGKTWEEDENVQLLSNSFKYGLRIWVYDSSKIGSTIFIDKAYGFPGIKTPFKYSYDFGSKAVKNYAEVVRTSKDGSIDYFSSIQERYIPREKWGTWSTNSGIDLNFGLANGDPSKGFPIVLGDANVHCLMAGQSGAGKSAAINQMLLSLLTKYSPRELMLVMIDFKNVEFSTFTKPDPKSDGKLSIIPHARIMAGTKDGEYALSIFDFLIAEMERRQKVFGEVKQKKLEDYNNLMREQGHPEKCLPRILLLIDEFQVMFTEADSKIVEKIQDRIRSLAKLARAFGCHMWFTSQSMSGTMSADVQANFSLRAALRCTKEVSEQVIGNGAAGQIKAKFGYLYTNDSTGQDPTKNILWRVPYVSTKNILKVMNESAELYASQGMNGYNAEFYDEDQLHKDKELFDFYKDHAGNAKVENKHLLVLGRRTNFSTNNAPVNFYLEPGDFNNVLIAGNEDKDLLNITRTIFDNIEVHGLKYIISCMDEDAFTLLDLDERLKGPFLQWSRPNVPLMDWIDADKSPLTAVINKRLQNPTESYDPLAVILYNWDKAPGFGISENYKFTEVFKQLLRDGPTVDVHFYLIIKTRAELSRGILALFKHKICCLEDESTSIAVLDNSKGNKLPNKGNFGIYMRGNEETKFKIYQHEFTRKLADKDLTL